MTEDEKCGIGLGIVIGLFIAFVLMLVCSTCRAESVRPCDSVCVPALPAELRRK